MKPRSKFTIFLGLILAGITLMFGNHSRGTPMTLLFIGVVTVAIVFGVEVFDRPKDDKA